MLTLYESSKYSFTVFGYVKASTILLNYREANRNKLLELETDRRLLNSINLNKYENWPRVIATAFPKEES